MTPKTGIFYLLICLMVIAAPAYGEAVPQPGFIKGGSVNFRFEPGYESRIISVLDRGLRVAIVEQTDSWYKVQLSNGQVGWVYRQFVEVVTSAAVSSGEGLAVFPVNEIIAYAKSLLGITYIYGGESLRGFDCSGFTRYVFTKFGINLPHQAKQQMEKGAGIQSRTELIPGDLVFFKTMGSSIVNHVGIYLGDNRFIHASSGYGAVRISPIDSGYYDRCYVGGRRLLTNDAGEISVG